MIPFCASACVSSYPRDQMRRAIQVGGLRCSAEASSVFFVLPRGYSCLRSARLSKGSVSLSSITRHRSPGIDHQVSRCLLRLKRPHCRSVEPVVEIGRESAVRKCEVKRTTLTQQLNNAFTRTQQRLHTDSAPTMTQQQRLRTTDVYWYTTHVSSA